VRWLTRLDPADLTRYHAAVEPLVGRIERSLGPEVFAIRARWWRHGWRAAPWRPARRAWRRAVRSAIAGARARTAFAVADVRDCYGSISPDTVRMLLGPDADQAVRLLEACSHAGVRGLPIGPDPSAFVANAILARLDQTLRRAGVDHVRWVDDLVAWGEADDVRRALDRLAASAEALGLALHDRKTRLLGDRDEARSLTLGDRDSSIIAAP
jgi:nucleotide-binding universal stress UspA family protein